MERHRANRPLLAAAALCIMGFTASRALAGDTIQISPIQSVAPDFNAAVQQGLDDANRARAMSAMRRLNPDDPVSVQNALNSLIRAGQLDQANQLRAILRARQDASQAAQRWNAQQALRRNVGELASQGRCDDAKALALQSGDFDLASTVVQVCTTTTTHASAPSQ